MGLKGSNTTADYIDWDMAISLIRKLYRDKDYIMSLFIGCGIFTGLRVSDLRQLTWEMILSNDKFEITEQKTGKHRIIKLNDEFRNHILKCKEVLNITNLSARCFLSRMGTVLTTQIINRRLKEIKKKYNLKVENLSCHSLRKTFGRKIFESSGDNAQLALVKLSELFNHSSISITKVYLGLKQEEILSAYDLLDF